MENPAATRLATDSGSSQVGEGEERGCPLSRRVRARGLRLLSARESNRVPWSSQPCLKMMEADRSGINLKVSALWAPSGNSPGNHSAGARMTKALTGRGEVEARVGQILPDYAQRLEPLSLVLPAMCLGREERRSVLIRALKNRTLFFFFFLYVRQALLRVQLCIAN